MARMKDLAVGIRQHVGNYIPETPDGRHVGTGRRVDDRPRKLNLECAICSPDVHDLCGCQKRPGMFNRCPEHRGVIYGTVGAR